MKVKDPAQMRRLRKAKHYSQEQLAFLVKKSQQSISLIEKGEMRTISEDFAIALAGRLDRDWEELFEAHEDAAMPVVTNAVRRTRDKVPA